jgi:flagellar biosynthesis regulator FlaF
MLLALSETITRAPARAAIAYGVSQSARSQRAQESEVYATLAGRLRAAIASGGRIDTTRAASDARRLFSVLEELTLHPSCPLPCDLRASIVGVARCALRETEEPEPDLDFLASIAEDFAAGLSDRREPFP